jgi:chromosome partitioning protein
VSTIAIANQKGGSAKTTTALHLGVALADLGKRILLVDMDPQGHLAESLGISSMELENEISSVLDRRRPIQEALISVRLNLDLVPSNIRLSYIEGSLFTKHRREDRLKHALEPVMPSYDYAIIDCPPSLGILTVNALAAANQVLIPMACEYFAMLGVSLLLQSIEDAQAEINPGLSILGIVPTRYARTVNAREILAQLREELGGRVHVFEHPIPETVRFREAAALGKTLFDHDSDNAGAAAYRALAEEIAHG